MHGAPMSAGAALTSFRMTTDDFAKYKNAQLRSGLMRDDAYMRLASSAANDKLVVRGYNDDATDALKAANSDGTETLEVPWSATDSVVCLLLVLMHGLQIFTWLSSAQLFIMKRLEDRLAIPLSYWVCRYSNRCAHRQIS